MGGREHVSRVLKVRKEGRERGGRRGSGLKDGHVQNTEILEEVLGGGRF
jgi:hypothetical protein